MKIKTQYIRQKTGAQNIVREIKQYQEKWLQHAQRMDTNRLPKQTLQYKPKDEETLEDRGKDGGNNFTLRIKEKEARLNIQEHDDDEKICTLFELFMKIPNIKFHLKPPIVCRVVFGAEGTQKQFPLTTSLPTVRVIKPVVQTNI